MENKRFLIFGGTGSLGTQLTERYLPKNEIYLYSRDESKHWNMQINFNSPDNLHFVIGDVRDRQKVEQTILRVQPHIIIIAAAMKHIDRCEYETNECIGTNLLGTQNVLDSVEVNKERLKDLESVCFISTDKACSPVNIYGMCKAASECLVIEKAKEVKDFKFVCVRYGNVLNSRGSIIPKLHKIGKDDNIKNFTITSDQMTRFVMTLDQSVDLIEHAILKGESGDIVIPKLISCKIVDLIDIFAEKYDKPVINTGLRPGEKMLESLINDTQSKRLVFGEDGYMYIRPPFLNFQNDFEERDYNSKINPLGKEELKEYLISLDLY